MKTLNEDMDPLFQRCLGPGKQRPSLEMNSLQFALQHGSWTSFSNLLLVTFGMFWCPCSKVLAEAEQFSWTPVVATTRPSHSEIAQNSYHVSIYR